MSDMCDMCKFENKTFINNISHDSSNIHNKKLFQLNQPQYTKKHKCIYVNQGMNIFLCYVLLISNLCINIKKAISNIYSDKCNNENDEQFINLKYNSTKKQGDS